MLITTYSVLQNLNIAIDSRSIVDHHESGVSRGISTQLCHVAELAEVHWLSRSNFVTSIHHSISRGWQKC